MEVFQAMYFFRDTRMVVEGSGGAVLELSGSIHVEGASVFFEGDS